MLLRGVFRFLIEDFGNDEKGNPRREKVRFPQNLFCIANITGFVGCFGYHCSAGAFVASSGDRVCIDCLPEMFVVLVQPWDFKAVEGKYDKERPDPQIFKNICKNQIFE